MNVSSYTGSHERSVSFDHVSAHLHQCVDIGEAKVELWRLNCNPEPGDLLVVAPAPHKHTMILGVRLHDIQMVIDSLTATAATAAMATQACTLETISEGTVAVVRSSSSSRPVASLVISKFDDAKPNEHIWKHTVAIEDADSGRCDPD